MDIHPHASRVDTLYPVKSDIMDTLYPVINNIYLLHPVTTFSIISTPHHIMEILLRFQRAWLVYGLYVIRRSTSSRIKKHACPPAPGIPGIGKWRRVGPPYPYPLHNHQFFPCPPVPLPFSFSAHTLSTCPIFSGYFGLDILLLLG